MKRKEAIEKTERFLDTIDILSYARRNETLNELMERLENAHSEVSEIQEEPFETYLFNWMCQDEFCDYMKRRYGDKFKSTEVVTIWYSLDKQK